MPWTRFTGAANAVLQGQDEPGMVRDELMSFGDWPERHLENQEDMRVPVILRRGPDQLQ